ncbi:hypothetical protein [Sphingobacterium sp. SGR-19]|nr:hypothetical protein [Sphingobacterium sp. SGR-19]
MKIELNTLPATPTAKNDHMLLDIISGKCAEVPAEQFEKMDAR